MIKKNTVFYWPLLASIVCLFLAILSPVLVQARDGLTILDSSIEAQFPAQLSFNLSAQSDVDITDIRLHYIVDRASFAQITSEVYIEFAPGSTVNAEWTWDMRKTGGLPPGAGVDYWWTVEDANGDKVETAPVPVQFDDVRYTWNSLTEGKVTIYWYEGKVTFAQQVMATAQQVLTRLAEDTGAYLEKPVNIYIYADSRDLRGAMIFPQEWTGGVAFTRFGTIAIGIAPDNLNWGKRATAHELAHLVVHQMTFNPYGDLPTWLNEGLAMYAEGELAAEFAAYLNKATAENSLLSVRSLSSPFSAHAEETYLAYAQSYSLVEFLVANYGQGKMLELLNTFRQGSSYDAALERVYGFDTEGLDEVWQNYITGQSQTTGLTTEATPTAVIGALAELSTELHSASSLHPESRAWQRGW